MKYMTKYGEIEFASEAEYQAYLQHASDDSHKKFMDGRPLVAHVGDDGEVKQSLRRHHAIKDLVNEVALHRVQPGTGAAVEYISFEQWQELSSQYKQAIDSGDSHNVAHRQVGFQPMAIYMNKLMSKRADGTIRKIRDLLVNEVGVRPNGVIVCLQDRMPGDLGTVVVGPHTKHNTGR